MAHKAHTRYTLEDAQSMRPVCTRSVWGFELTSYVAALCEDGIVRRADMGQSDTFFTTPAVVKVKGKRVYGFVIRQMDGYDTPSDDDPATWKFIASNNQVESREGYRDSINA
jgi:hypothetical protein